MPTRDVELVIRARDTATSAIKKFNQALEEILGVNQKLSASSKDTESTLQQLGGVIREVAASIAAVSPTGRLAAESDRAAEAISKLDGKLAELRAQQSQLNTELRETSQVTTAQVVAFEQAEAAVRRQREEIAKAGEANKKYKNKVKEVKTEIQGLVAANERLGAELAEAGAQYEKAEKNLKDIQDNVEGVNTATKKYAANLDRAEKAVIKWFDAQQNINQQLYENQTAQDRANKSLAAYQGYVTRTANAVEREKATLAQLKIEYDLLATNLKKAKTEQQGLEKQFNATTRSMSKQLGELDKAQAQWNELQITIEKGEKALSQLAGTLSGQINQSLDRQRLATLRAKKEWSEATVEVSQLSAAMRKTGASAELTEAQQRAIDVARKLKAIYEAQRQGLYELQKATRDTAGDYQGLAARQEAFETSSRNTASVVARLVQELVEVRQAATQAAAGMQGATNEISAFELVARRAGQTTAGFGAQLAAGLSGRNSISILQRMRGEVLAFIVAHTGLYGVISALRQTIEAYSTLEAATSRLNAVFDGDAGAVGAELDFIRRQADRLGISFGVLSDFYTKFAAAAKGTNLAGANTRKIFLSVAEAARVNKLSMEQMAGVFKALEQIVSKQGVQLEELKGQLGDRLPGAVRIMADALGISTKELVKLTEQGELSSDALLAFAEELDKRFGSQLQKSLKTTTAEMGRFQNNVFQALIAFGQAGFIESFTDLLKQLNEQLRSAEGVSFFERLSEGMAGLVDAFAFLIENFDTAISLFTAFIALKLSPALVLGIGNLNKAWQQFRISIAQSLTAMSAAEAGMTRLQRITAVAAVRMRALGAAIAGISTGAIGTIAIVGLGFALGQLLTRTRKSTEALVEHRKQLDELKNAYEQNGLEVKGLVNELKELNFFTAQKSLEELEGNFDIATEAMDEFIRKNLINVDKADKNNPFRSLVEELAHLNEVTKNTGDYEKFLARIEEYGLRFENDEGASALISIYNDLGQEVAKYGKAVELAALKSEYFNATEKRKQEIIDKIYATTDKPDLYADLVDGTDKLILSQKQLDEVMSQSEDALEKVRNAAEKSGGSFQKFIKELKGVSITELENQFKALQNYLKIIVAEMKVAVSGSDLPAAEQNPFNQLIELFENGQIEIEEFRDRLDELAQTTANDAVRDLASNMLSALKNLEPTVDQAGKLALALKAAGGEAKDMPGLLARIAKEDPFENANKGIDDLLNGFYKVNEFRWTKVNNEVKGIASYLERFNAELEKKNVDPFDETVEGANEVKGAFDGANSSIAEFVKEAKDGVGSVVSSVDGLAKSTGGVAQEFEALDSTNISEMESAFEATAAAAENSAKSSEDFAQQTGDAIESVAAKAQSAAAETAQTLTTANADFYARIAEQLAGVTEVIVGDSQTRIEQFRAEGETSVNEFSATVSALLQALLESIAAMVARARETAGQMGEAMRSGAQVAESAIDSFVALAIADLDRLIAKANEAASAVASIGGGSDGLAGGGPAIPGRAGGGSGKVSGRGTSTSDSNLFWLSTREWVIRARAAQYYGDGFMRMINNMAFPRDIFARKQGGPSIPKLVNGGSASSSSSSSVGSKLTIAVGNEEFDVFSSRSTIRKLDRAVRRITPRAAGGLTMKDA